MALRTAVEIVDTNRDEDSLSMLTLLAAFKSGWHSPEMITILSPFSSHGTTDYLLALSLDRCLVQARNKMGGLITPAADQSIPGPRSETSNPDCSSIIIAKAKGFVKEYMSKYDGSHDYHHIQRVLAMAQHILTIEQKEHSTIPYNPLIVTLAALMHDVGDHKYITPSVEGGKGVDPNTVVESTLISFGASPEQASLVQTIAKSVSYSHEIQNTSYVQNVLLQHPELAIVQDADRLDAIGAVGIGRTFTYGGAKGTKDGMLSTIQHFDEKLERLEAMMKTDEGRRLARERTERLKVFQSWWEEENSLVSVLED